MDYLTDDALYYLIGIILNENSNKDYTSFLVCNKIKSLSDKMINDKIKRNYKPLIKDNYLKNPLRSYSIIYKVYGNNFVVSIEKLDLLLREVISNNNKELFDILNDTMPSFMKLGKNKSKLFSSHESQNKQNMLVDLTLENLKENRYDLITLRIFSYVIQHAYIIITTTYLEQLKIIIKNEEYKKKLIHFCLINDDINILQLIIDSSNSNNLLSKAIILASPKITTYISQNYGYDRQFVIDYLFYNIFPLEKIDDNIINILSSIGLFLK